MLQATPSTYDHRALLRLNGSYDCAHGLTPEDVDMANAYVSHIEQTRSDKRPGIGDRVIYVSRYGDWSDKALIERFDGDECTLCLDPSIPFIRAVDNGIGCSVSGGPFTSVKTRELRFAGWTEGCFKDWGHCGSCANGAVVFQARVAQWEYREPNPLYGDFTTQTWRKVILNKLSQPCSDCLYHGEGIGFEDDAEFARFVADFHGTVFEGRWENQFVVWCYRDTLRALPQAEWDAVAAPASRRKLYNELRPVKVVEDHTTHERICCYVQPTSDVKHS